MSSNEINMGDFQALEFASNHFKAWLRDLSYKILSGSEDTLKLDVPFSHRIIKIIIRQTDSSNTEALDALTINVRRDAGEIVRIPILLEHLYLKDNLLDGYWTLTFGDLFEYEACAWTLAFTGTATNRIHLAVYLQRLP